MDKELEEWALDIVTNPKITWQQITERKGYLFRRRKYIVDGIRNGILMRIVFEPKGRGILKIFPLGIQSIVKNDDIFMKEFVGLFDKLKKNLHPYDEKIIQDFLDQEEPLMAFEIMCDILEESRICLREVEIQKIKELAAEKNLPPGFTWELLIVIDDKTQQPKLVLQDESFWKAIEDGLFSILEDVDSRLLAQDAQSIREYIDAGEYILALEDLVSCYVLEKAKISRKSFETLIRLLADFDFPHYDESNFNFDG